jgi:hypothetical protein
MTSRKVRPWFWRFRRDGPPAHVEQLEDGRWRVLIGNAEIGLADSPEAARELVEQLDAGTERER